jgi:flavin reductase (DIM6/NTAB) family NADH-FMN oxidoreductase RutF
MDDEEYDKLRRRVLWKMPYGLYVLGARAGDRRNGMTINFVTQVATEPKLVGVGITKEAVTHELVGDGRIFALNLIDREDRAIVRKFVKPVEVDEAGRTLNGFAFHDAKTGAPVLDQAVAYVDCEVRQAVDCGDHTFFIGEVVDAAFQKDEETPVLRMEDTRMNYGG